MGSVKQNMYIRMRYDDRLLVNVVSCCRFGCSCRYISFVCRSQQRTTDHLILAPQDCNPPKGVSLGYINTKPPHTCGHDVSPKCLRTFDFTWCCMTSSFLLVWAITTWKPHFGNGHRGRYLSSVTNSPTSVTGKCPLPITGTCNGH
jgi:hypothetical protein